MADNPVFEAARTLLAVRQFADRPVPDEVVRRVAESGWLTASAQNKQPWHFVVVRDRDALQRLGRAVRTGPYTANAAFAIAVAIEKDSPVAASDASRAIQTMLLVAWGEGVAGNWTGFGGLTEAAAELGIPDRYDLFAVLPFGYPAKRIGLGRKNRRPLTEVVSAERFGQPID